MPIFCQKIQNHNPRFANFTKLQESEITNPNIQNWNSPLIEIQEGMRPPHAAQV